MADSIPWKNIRALSFDIYGTLIDWHGGIAKTARASALEPFLPTDNEELNDRIYDHASRLERERPTMRKSDLNAEALKQYAQELRVVEDHGISQNEVDRTAREFGDSIGSHEAFDDTIAAMQRLKKHYKLIALSNIDHDSLDATLKNGFKGNPFDAAYIAEDVGSYKPDRRNFDYLLEHMKQDFGIDRKDHVHVAQSVFHDLPATKAMGIPNVWIDRYDVLGSSGKTASEHQAELGYVFRVTSLKELADIVDQAFKD